MSLRIIVTGGTFEKRYDELRGELTFQQSHLPEILRHARLTVPVEVEVNQLVDSLFMTDEERARILEACRAAPEPRLVIVHGTDTMVTTATQLGHAGLAKTIVLTGALIPYSVAGTDSVFNLGFAMAAALLLPEGVYVAMNGQFFPWDAVRKDRERGVFERIEPLTMPNAGVA